MNIFGQVKGRTHLLSLHIQRSSPPFSRRQSNESSSSPSPSPHAAMKRIPLIKFPKRHPKSSSSPSSGSTSQPAMSSSAESLPRSLFSRTPSNTSPSGKASDQPKRTPVTQEEIEAIMLGGCI